MRFHQTKIWLHTFAAYSLSLKWCGQHQRLSFQIAWLQIFHPKLPNPKKGKKTVNCTKRQLTFWLYQWDYLCSEYISPMFSLSSLHSLTLYTHCLKIKAQHIKYTLQIHLCDHGGHTLQPADKTMIAYDFDWVIPEIPVKTALWECC